MGQRRVVDAFNGIVKGVRVLGAAAVEIIEGVVFGVVRCAAFGDGVSLKVNLFSTRFAILKNKITTFYLCHRHRCRVRRPSGGDRRLARH